MDEWRHRTKQQSTVVCSQLSSKFVSLLILLLSALEPVWICSLIVEWKSEGVLTLCPMLGAWSYILKKKIYLKVIRLIDTKNYDLFLLLVYFWVLNQGSGPWFGFLLISDYLVLFLSDLSSDLSIYLNYSWSQQVASLSESTISSYRSILLFSFHGFIENSWEHDLIVCPIDIL